MSLFKKSYSAALNPGLRGVTSDDLIREIQRDGSLAASARNQVAWQVGHATAPRAPLSQFASKATGAVIANVAGKYFGMSPVGRALVTAVGWGVGSQLHDKLNKA